MKTRLSYLLNVLFMIVILLVTFYILQKEQNMAEIFEELRRVDKFSIGMAVAAGIVSLILQGISLQVILCSLRAPIRLIESIGYSFVGFLFNALTPSASGGQPMQVWFMRRSGISVGASSVALLFWTILYKVALILLEGYVIIFQGDFLRLHLGKYEWLFILGMAVNIISIVLYSLVVFSKKGVQKLADLVAWFCHKVRIVRRREKIQRRLDVLVTHYQESADYMRTHWNVALVVLLITILQRLCYFAVTWFVYRSFGLSQYSFLEILILQSFVSVCIDILPMPGGVGLNEGFFVTIFRQVMGQQLAFSAMLLSRGASFYVLLILSAIITTGMQVAAIYGNREQRAAKK